MFNCIYSDGSVIPVDDRMSCPIPYNPSIELVDVVELTTTIDVTTPAPMPWGLLALGTAALFFFMRRR